MDQKQRLVPLATLDTMDRLGMDRTEIEPPSEERTWICDKCNDSRCTLTYDHADHSTVPQLVEMGQCIHLSFQDADWQLRGK